MAGVSGPSPALAVASAAKTVKLPAIHRTPPPPLSELRRTNRGKSGDVQMSKKILRLPKVKEKTGRGHSWIYAEVAAGRFPKPIRLGPDSKSVGWLEHEIDDWIDRQVAARDDAEREVA